MVLAGEALLDANPQPDPRRRSARRSPATSAAARATSRLWMRSSYDGGEQRQCADGGSLMADLQYVGTPAQPVWTRWRRCWARRSMSATTSCPGCSAPAACAATLPHARIIRLDVTPALQVPGVVAAITSRRFRRPWPLRLPGRRTCSCWPTSGCATWAMPSPPSPPRTRMRWQAGLAAIVVEFEPLPAVFDPAAALEPDAPVIGERPWDAPETAAGQPADPPYRAPGRRRGSPRRHAKSRWMKLQHHAPGARLSGDRGRPGGTLARR